MNIPQQSSFLYKANWSPEIDAMLLRTIVRMKNEQNWKGVIMPPHFLIQAGKEIFEEIGCNFSWDELYGRLQEMENRYSTFKEIVSFPGTYWDVNTNTVMADEKLWSAIFQKNKYAGAYYYRGEPEFSQLAALFGPGVVKQKHERQVVVISDTTIPEEDGAPCEGQHASDSEEVSSPVGPQATTLRRRLFQDEARPLDRESTNDKGQYYYIVGPDGEMKLKLQDVYPDLPRDDPKAPEISNKSSCASSSPSKWWKNPFN